MREFLLVALLSSTVCAAEFSTFIGDSNDYHVTRVAADAAGNTYLAGSRLPANEIFVMKLNPTGKIALFAVISGKGSDTPNDLALDAAGNIYLAGSTNSPNFPLRNPLQSTPGPGFLLKLSPDATQILYSTYYRESIAAFAIDSAGNFYVTGTTFSPTYPVTPGLPSGTVGLGAAGSTGAFLTKIAAAGDRIAWSALIVGHNKDCGAGSSCFLSERNTSGTAVAVDPSGAAYLAGNTDTNDLPTTHGALLEKGTGAFVAKVNPAGSALVYLTYIGQGYYPLTPFTNPANTAKAIAVDPDGHAYIVGATSDPKFPATQGAYQTAFHGTANFLPPADAFVAKLQPDGSALAWATYLGGKDSDAATAIAIDSSGSAWVSGSTASADFPNMQGWSQGAGFIAGLAPNGTSLPYSARFPDDTAGQLLALDPSGLLHVAGPTGLVSTIAPQQTPTPHIFGIANAAAGPATGRLAPGEVIAIYGPHIGPPTHFTADVQVSIGGINAPVLFASDSQINAVVPFGAQGLPSAPVHIVSNGAAGPDFPAVIVEADPQVFRNPDGYAAALNQDGSLNSAANPATMGTVVSIFATGAGAPSFASQIDGQIARAANDFQCCQVTVMGLPATVLYGGAAPGLLNGVVQINFRLPVFEFFAAQPYLEFTITANNQTSLPVRIWTK
jgi:uncharacterized protein (TIGR03437 family)